jgi:hypothetical protein
MSRKHFSWLLLITFVVAALVLLIPGKTGEESSPEQTVFLPGVAKQVNDIEWLRLTSGGGVTIATLKRERMAWVVAEASGYRADWTRLKILLSGLSQAEVIEEKTANPEYYPRLGVENVSLPDAGGVMVEFSDDSGLPALIIGKSAQGRDGQYVRLRDSAQSALIDRRLDVSVERSDWLDRDVIDISNAEVVEVVITHPDGESIKALKFSADDENFQLQEIPDGQEIKSEWNVNSLAGNLALLSLDSVAPDSGFDWSGSIRFRLLTADGLLLETDLLAVESASEAEIAEESVESEYWVRLKAGLYTTALHSGVEEVDDTSGAGSRAEAINNRVSGWAYRISRQKFDSMSKRKDDLLKPVDSN